MRQHGGAPQSHPWLRAATDGGAAAAGAAAAADVSVTAGVALAVEGHYRPATLGARARNVERMARQCVLPPAVAVVEPPSAAITRRQLAVQTLSAVYQDPFFKDLRASTSTAETLLEAAPEQREAASSQAGVVRALRLIPAGVRSLSLIHI